MFLSYIFMHIVVVIKERFRANALTTCMVVAPLVVEGSHLSLISS